VNSESCSLLYNPLFKIVPNYKIFITVYTVFRALQSFQNSWNHLKITGVRNAKRKKERKKASSLMGIHKLKAPPYKKKLASVATWRPRNYTSLIYIYNKKKIERNLAITRRH